MTGDTIALVGVGFITVRLCVVFPWVGLTLAGAVAAFVLLWVVALLAIWLDTPKR